MNFYDNYLEGVLELYETEIKLFSQVKTCVLYMFQKFCSIDNWFNFNVC